MGDPLHFTPDRNSAPLLATSCVLLLGVAACIAIAFSSGEVHPMPIAIAVGVGLSLGFILWCLRDRPVARQRSWFAWVMHRPHRKARVTYELRVAHPRVNYGDKHPATLEELRDQQDPTRTWVPSQSAPRPGREPTRRPSAED